jgi:flavin reductase (DIM6/NTAB) family NADH-FMN oxidoreductase RutF
VDDEAFDRLVRASNTSMVVVAAHANGEMDACLVGFHSQCSIDPLRYAVWLSKANHTYRIARNAELLSVHWLRAGDVELAVSVGSVTLDTDRQKMDRVPWRIGAQGAIEIHGVAGLLVGRILDTHDGGDHECFILEPLEARAIGGPVLRFDEVEGLDAGHPADPGDVPEGRNRQ